MTRPHDALFKAVFQHPGYAAAELQHILDPKVAKAIAWGSLRLESGEYIDDELADQHSDLLFSAQCSAPAGHRRALVYLLFDHQSRNDPTMPLRLLGYMQRIWSRWYEAHRDEPLPLIVPALLAQVEGGWTASRRLSHMFSPDAPAVLLALQPDFEFAVDDLASASDDDLRARAFHAFPAVALWLMRDVRTPDDLMNSMVAWAPLLASLEQASSGKEALFRLLAYLERATGEVPSDEFSAKLKQLAPAVEKLTMSLADQWEAKGIAKGEAKGKVEGKAESVLLILETRGVHVSGEIRARITGCTEADQLDQWLRRAVVSDDAAALFES